MAVQKNLQGKGIGEAIMSFAETLARDKGYKTLMMHARLSPLAFTKNLATPLKATSLKR